MTRTSNPDWVRGLLRAIRNAVESLPTEEEIKLGVQAIDELTGFLQTLRSQIVSQPTAERREDVERAIRVLETFLSSTRGPFMVGAPRGQRPRVSDREVDVGAVRHTLESLPLDEIRVRLQDPSVYSTDLLRRLARELGLRLDSKLTRTDLADAILKRGFANPRAYEGLRGQRGNRCYRPRLERMTLDLPV
jgi:hypothetical protein